MDKTTLKKQISNNIGRNFNLAFNQIAMYNVYHKSVVGSLDRLFNSFQEGFKVLPMVSISLNQEQLFIEDEPLDSRINTNRIVAHFKKTDIQSLAFESGMKLEDLTFFLEMLTDLNRYPNADVMKKVLEKKVSGKIRINYFVYRKVKQDETVVHSSQVDEDGKVKGASAGEGKDVPTTEDILTIMAADILSEEAQKNISVQNLMQGPAEFSQMLIDADLAAANKAEGGQIKPGSALVQSLNRFQKDVDNVLAGKTDVRIAQLAEDIFKLKRQLIKGIEDQKAKGIVYLDQKVIDREIDNVTDGVLVKLITEEYSKGDVSIKRLAQIVLRITSDTPELQRILPKLKRALSAAGMPMDDYLRFVQALKDELQSDELTSALERSAEEIGLEGEALIQEILKNPQNAAELIYLASEIRRSGEDEKILSDILVDYVERAGSELAMDELNKTDDISEKKIGGIFSRIRSELVDKLRSQAIDSDVLSKLEKRLTDRMEESIRQLKSTMIFRRVNSEEDEPPTKEAILKLLQTHSKDNDEMKEIVAQVRQALSDRGVEENQFQQIYEEIMAKPPEKKDEKNKIAPPGSLNRGSTLFVLEKEILRANRYDTPFSILSFTIVKATPKGGAKPGSIKTEEIINEFVVTLSDIVRETDLVGMLSAKMVVVIQPMTEGKNAKIALGRITSALKSREFTVKEIPFDINFAGVVTPFDAERTPDLKRFVTIAQTDLKNLANRVSTIQRML